MGVEGIITTESNATANLETCNIVEDDKTLSCSSSERLHFPSHLDVSAVSNLVCREMNFSS